MNGDEKESIKQVIIKKIDATKKSIETFKNLSKPVAPDNAIGRLTRMEAINNKSINESSLAKSKNALEKLEKSLTLIDDPDFGACRNCEEPIPHKRLLIMPESSLCVLCAEKLNKRHF